MQIDRSGRLKGIAAEAATAFVDGGEPLNEKVAQLVERHRLTGEQASTVCKMANHLVHASLRSGSSMVEFPLADPEKVASMCRGSRPKVAMVHKIASVDPETAEPFEKTASFDEETEIRDRTAHQVNVRDLERAKLACQDAIDAVRSADWGVRAAMRKLGHRLLNYAKLEGGDLDFAMRRMGQYQKLAARPELLVKVAKAVAGVGAAIGHRVEFSDETLHCLTPEGWAKNAAEIDPGLLQPSLSIAGMPVHVVDGTRSVWVELDTLIDQYDDLCGNKDKLVPMQDRVRYLRRVVEQRNGGTESVHPARAV